MWPRQGIGRSFNLNAAQGTLDRLTPIQGRIDRKTAATFHCRGIPAFGRQVDCENRMRLRQNAAAYGMDFGSDC
jgi:hypothetical protein